MRSIGPAVTREQCPAFLRNSSGRLDLPGPTQEASSIPRRNSRIPRNSSKTTWLPRHRKMKPFPATAPQEKSHVRNWRSKGNVGVTPKGNLLRKKGKTPFSVLIKIKSDAKIRSGPQNSDRALSENDNKRHFQNPYGVLIDSINIYGHYKLLE